MSIPKRLTSLLSHSREYYNGEEDGYYPVSKIDLEILFLFKELLKGSQNPTSVVKLLFQKWKEDLHDETLLKQLNEVYSHIKSGGELSSEMDALMDSADVLVEDGEGDGVEYQKPGLLLIGDVSIPISFIRKIGKEKSFSEKDERNQYSIVLNSSPVENTMNNICIPYPSKKQRDAAHASLLNSLREYYDIIEIDSNE